MMSQMGRSGSVIVVPFRDEERNPYQYEPCCCTGDHRPYGPSGRRDEPAQDQRARCEVRKLPQRFDEDLAASRYQS